jgi:L-amino acid N-acyltransferase YncA
VRLLIDTNVLISSEPTQLDDIEPVTALSLDLARLASGTHRLLVHPRLTEEINNDRNAERRAVRLQVQNRYPPVNHPPAIQPELERLLGQPQEGSNDWFDHLNLACVYGNAVEGLVTQDQGVHKKARVLGIDDRVYYLADAVAFLGRLENKPPDFVPRVSWQPLHTIQLQEEFFNSLRKDYPTFDQWFADAAREGRESFVITGPSNEIAGICIVKPSDDQLGLGGKVTKISTLKVADKYKGSRFGELLLKALFRYANRNEVTSLWLTVYPKYDELINLLQDFGFYMHGTHWSGELQLVKRLTPATDAVPLSSLDYHIKYGPPAIQTVRDQTFVIPILPVFHRGLFPDHREFSDGIQLTLPGTESPTQPYGNAISKAYLSSSTIRRIEPGATLLFYRSRDLGAVTTVGVAERTLISMNADEIVAFVGSRTVYSMEQIVRRVAKGRVLSILFRHDRFLDQPISRREMMENELLQGTPQAICGVRPEGFEWLNNRLEG